MSAIVRACKSSTKVKNTGTQSSLFPMATAMVFLVPKNFSFTEADLASDPVGFFAEKIHADGADRIFPLFGNQVPIRLNTNTKGTDNTVTLDDGSIIFVSYAQTNKLFGTTDGGLCYAKALSYFNATDFRVIEIDIQGTIVCKNNFDGTYGGLTATLSAPAIDFADLKNPAKSYFQIGYMPDYYVRNAALLTDGTQLMDLIGLLDYSLVQAAPPTTTVIKVGITDDCCGDSAVADYGAALVAADAFIVTDISTGADVEVAATIVNNIVNLTGVFASGKSYLVSVSPPSVLYDAGIEGIEISPITVVIP